MTTQEIALHALTAAIAAALSAAGAGTLGEQAGRSQVEAERVPPGTVIHLADVIVDLKAENASLRERCGGRCE